MVAPSVKNPVKFEVRTNINGNLCRRLDHYSRSLNKIIETEQMITEHIRVRHIGSVEYISGWKVQDMNDGITVTQSASI